MISSPTVSVVMPTYNRAHLLSGVIDAILGQDYQDLELLIVDDCSTDQTVQEIGKLQQKDCRVRYLKLPQNQGVGNARQVGLENVSGKYIALADSDDVWIDGKLRTQVEILESNPEIDILFGDYLNIDYVDNKQQTGFIENVSGMKLLTTKHLQDHLWLVESGVDKGILISNFLAVPTMILRASVFNRVGGFNRTLVVAADHEFGFRAAVLGAKFAYLDYPLIYRYRYADSNTANSIKSNTMMNKALGYCLELCKTRGNHELIPQVKSAIRRTNTYLMREYGKAGNRIQVWNTYKKAVSIEYSWKDFLLFLVSMGGPKIFSVIRLIRKHMPR